MRIAIAGCRFSEDSPPTELYPDPDAPLLEAALLAGDAGVTAVDIVSWDDPGADWASFAAVFVSSTWDSVDRPGEYLAWTAAVDAATLLLNPHDVIAWNLDKRYLADLDAAGIPIVPTVWVGPDDPVPTFPRGDVVVKPAVSAGGRSTAWYGAASHAAAQDHVRSLQRTGATAMVQEHVAGVAAVGEVKSVFVDGTYSHAVRVGGLLDRDAGTMERPWEKEVPTSATQASAAERAVGDAVVAELVRRFGAAPVYTRVDLVLDALGAPRVLEVELIEPMLFLGTAPGSEARLATAILSRVATAGRR